MYSECFIIFRSADFLLNVYDIVDNYKGLCGQQKLELDLLLMIICMFLLLFFLYWNLLLFITVQSIPICNTWMSAMNCLFTVTSMEKLFPDSTPKV